MILLPMYRHLEQMLCNCLVATPLLGGWNVRRIKRFVADKPTPATGHYSYLTPAHTHNGPCYGWVIAEAEPDPKAVAITLPLDIFDPPYWELPHTPRPDF